MVVVRRSHIADESLQVGIPEMTVQNVLHQTLKFHAFKIQILCEIEDTNWHTRVEFENLMLNVVDEDNFL